MFIWGNDMVLKMLLLLCYVVVGMFLFCFVVRYMLIIFEGIKILLFFFIFNYIENFRKLFL